MLGPVGPVGKKKRRRRVVRPSSSPIRVALWRYGPVVFWEFPMLCNTWTVWSLLLLLLLL